MPKTARLLALMVCLGLALASAGCDTGDKPLAGRVVDDAISVQVPPIAMPSPDLSAGFGSAPEPMGSSSSRPSTAAAITGLGTRAVVATVPVSTGQRVARGDVIAILDSAALDAHLAATKAAARTAASQVLVLDTRLDDLAEARADLNDARSSALAAVSQLTRTRSELVSQRAKLRGLLAQLEHMKPPGQMPPGAGPPGTVPTGTVPPGGNTRPPALPDPAELRAGIAKLDSGIARIDAGLAKANSGLSRLADASSTLADARETLVDLRELARISASAAQIPVRLAGVWRSLAVLRAPEDGVITSVVATGAVLAPGATVAEIDPESTPLVSVWMAPDRAIALERRLREPGAITALASADWSAGASTSGTVARVGPRAEYPPTSLATQDVHLARAVEVTLEFPDPAFDLPTGAPVDIRIP